MLALASTAWDNALDCYSAVASLLFVQIAKSRSLLPNLKKRPGLGLYIRIRLDYQLGCADQARGNSRIVVATSEKIMLICLADEQDVFRIGKSKARLHDGHPIVKGNCYSCFQPEVFRFPAWLLQQGVL